MTCDIKNFSNENEHANGMELMISVCFCICTVFTVIHSDSELYCDKHLIRTFEVFNHFYHFTFVINNVDQQFLVYGNIEQMFSYFLGDI